MLFSVWPRPRPYESKSSQLRTKAHEIKHQRTGYTVRAGQFPFSPFTTSILAGRRPRVVRCPTSYSWEKSHVKFSTLPCSQSSVPARPCADPLHPQRMETSQPGLRADRDVFNPHLTLPGCSSRIACGVSVHRRQFEHINLTLYTGPAPMKTVNV